MTIIADMARCFFCGKKTMFGNNVSHAGNRTTRKFKANIKKVRISLDGKLKKIKVCTKCIKMGKHVNFSFHS